MKITETITRECCAKGDLRKYQGARDYAPAESSHPGLWFCLHCGQIWAAEHEELPIAGDMRKVLRRISV